MASSSNNPDRAGNPGHGDETPINAVGNIFDMLGMLDVDYLFGLLDFRLRGHSRRLHQSSL